MWTSFDILSRNKPNCTEEVVDLSKLVQSETVADNKKTFAINPKAAHILSCAD